MQGSEQQHGITVLFLYIGNAIAALVSVISGFLTVFSVIDYFLRPDSLSWWEFNVIVTGGSLASSVSFLIISFIVLIVLSRVIRKNYAVKDLRGGLWHNWCRAVVMIVLALSILTILIAVAMLLEGFLSGRYSFGAVVETCVHARHRSDGFLLLPRCASRHLA